MDSDVPVTTVWGLMIAGVLVILALLGLFAISFAGAREPEGPDPEQLRAEAEELAEHAAAAYAKAGRAAAVAEAARDRAAEAEEARDEAWRAQEAADSAYAAARRDVELATHEVEAAVAAQQAAAGEGDGDDRDRTVSRAALGAYKRGEISVEELRDVFRIATTDQFPVRSEQERVAYRFLTEQRAARRVYDRAAAAARAADDEARIAEIAASALADEAAIAAAEAHEAMSLARRYATDRRRQR